jgi:hypothetical protein
MDRFARTITKITITFVIFVFFFVPCDFLTESTLVSRLITGNFFSCIQNVIKLSSRFARTN